MATSGSKTVAVTSWNNLVFSWQESSQNIVTNSTSIKWTLKLVSTSSGRIDSSAPKNWSVTVNGVTVSGTNTVGIEANSTKTLASGSRSIPHNADGTRTFDYSFSQQFAITFGGSNIGTISGSGSGTLDTIPRSSSLTIANGTLGTAQTLTIKPLYSETKHKITYKLPSGTTGYIAGSSSTYASGTSISWTPPLDFATQNKLGTNVTFTVYLKTFTSGGVQLTDKAYTVTMAIPASVKPSCTISVWDAEDVYGGLFTAYLKGLSRLHVKVTPTLAYGSEIASYSVSANGVTYTSAEFTTDFLKSSGTLTISATVTDKRGRKGTATTTITAWDYKPPVVSRLTAQRCDDDGTLNDQGAFVLVTFTASTTALNGENYVSYTLKYKKTTESNYTLVSMDGSDSTPNLENMYEVTDVTHIFAADTESSYDVRLEVQDFDSPTTRSTIVSTAFCLMEWNPDKKSVSIGKGVEENELFDVGISARFNKPVYGKVLGMDRLPAIPENSDLNNYMEPGCYAVQSNAIAESCANIPVDRAGRLEVWSATGEGVRLEQWSYLRQRFIPYNSANSVWEREITRSSDNVWRYYDWWQSSLTPIAAGKVYDKAAITIALNANTTLGVVDEYTQIPLNRLVVSTSDRLTLESNSVKIGANISYVKVSGQALIKCGSVTGNRHVRIQKVSGSVTTSHAWNCTYAVATSNTLYPIAPIIIPVAEGDLLKMVFYTSDAEDMNASGYISNGWQTYMTVEEL